VLALAVSQLFPSTGANLLFDRGSLQLATVGAVGMAISNVPWTLLRNERRPYPAASFQLLQFVAMTGAGLVLVLGLDRGFRGAVEAATWAPFATGVVSVIYIVRLPGSGMRLSRLRDALRFTLPFLPHFAAQWLLGAADLWILGRAGFEQQLGGYSLAVQVVVPVNLVITAWNLHVGPEMGETFRAGGMQEMRSRLPKVRLSYLAAGLIPGFALLLGLPFVEWIVGPEFGMAVAFVPFLLLALLPDTLYFADYHIIYYSGRSWWIGGATVAAAVINVGLGLALIPIFGAYGAVGARIAGALVRALLVMHIAAKSDADATPERTKDQP
jgi:O-antigen/teichoic acid export membrane protein